MSKETFVEATEGFLKVVDNLGDGVLPLVVALRQMAKALDEDGVTATLVNQYRLTYLAIKELTATDNIEEDPLEQLLTRGGN